jgi:hypothetical protein
VSYEEDEEEIVEDEFFDPSFLAELEGLATTTEKGVPAPLSLSVSLTDKLAVFLAGDDGGPPLDEEAFVDLPSPVVVERLNRLVEICRRGSQLRAVQAVENFIVFFQALVPTVNGEAARQIKRFFFHLAPTLIHIAYNDFGDSGEEQAEGMAALRNLETILIEISNVRLAPSESELVFKNIDQLAAFISVGEYSMSNEVISTQLLHIIRSNKMTRALFRLMEVEVSIQVYLKEKLGYLTPQIRVPEDIDALHDYGPIRILEEEILGEAKTFIQVHIPEIPFLREIVLHAVGEDGVGYDLRLDALGSTELNLPPGIYSLGLVYQP